MEALRGALSQPLPPGPWGGDGLSSPAVPAKRTLGWYMHAVSGAKASPGTEAGSEGQQARVPRWWQGIPWHPQLWNACIFMFISRL